ncbi:putative chitin synthase activator [Phaeomoniella chlamydospora]|uniref:Putative chitin synthase activator n=1 Tax=Phaeomoniella chlamydospora TaxID=158046 RepID=A0A0G2E9F1_PHACM|nr:putative chitin synthase activator [Phaeomoniella chlamydospora]
MSSGSELLMRGRRRSAVLTPDSYARARSNNSLSRSPDVRPQSYVDLLNVPYPQIPAVSTENLHNSHLRDVVGDHASLLTITQTLDMYRANVKKTNDPAIQYEFAVFMVTCAQEANFEGDIDSSTNLGQAISNSPIELLKEARSILQRLSDRSYPFAQYYLADGYASGMFNKGKEDYDKAFPLFISASKHGHAEAGYRAALCYEFGWGTRSDAGKAVQFYRQSASKNHPGAMLRLGRACLTGDLGLIKRYKEGVKWLKRAAETADFQYNAAPYELGVLHETGYGDDIFEDERYSAQLFTKSADLGHTEANYRLGHAYEHGKLTCPRDPALSIHFYTGAAQRGHPLAMMALCAWYMVGADPILEKDENEAYEWAKKAAEAGLPKAEYCVGYFTEMGIGCRTDSLEANVWYVRAAEHGDERAKHRLGAIKAAATGVDPEKAASATAPRTKGDEGGRKKKFGIF